MAIDPRYVATKDLMNYLPDKDTGAALANGLVYFFSDINRTTLKPVYEISGAPPNYSFVALPDPMSLNAAGEPINGSGDIVKPYFLPFDAEGNVELYFIEVFSAGGVSQFSLQAEPPGVEEGVTPVTPTSENNLIINGTYLDNIGATANPIAATNLVIATGNSEGLINPDVQFVKNNTLATDFIRFEYFALGDTPVPGQFTPKQFFHYVCLANPGGELVKGQLFVITPSVQELSEVAVTLSFSGSSSAGDTINPILVQYFGDGGSPSATVETSLGIVPLTPVAGRYSISGVFPSVTGKTIGTCGNAYSAIRLGQTLNQTSNFSMWSVQLQTGTQASPTYLYQTDQQVLSQLYSPRSGDVKISMRPLDNGWLPMNGGTIGSFSSGATARASTDTFILYYYLYQLDLTNVWVVVSGGRGASVFADFAANKTLTLSSALGRALAGANPAALPIVNKVFVRTTNNLTMDDTSSFYTGNPVQVSTTGTLPAPLVAATTYYVIQNNTTNIMLATTLNNARSGTNITLTTAGTGIQTASIITTAAPNASYFGEDNHTPVVGELVSHAHPTQGQISSGATLGFTLDTGGSAGTFSTNAVGGGAVFNITQSSLYLPVYIKL